jgi:NAD(P)-dependent dehydrogenase (short-subunit alcohol dehydrogenase family)
MLVLGDPLFPEAAQRRRHEESAMTHDMQGKVCLVTGATLGIGKETALGLARKGAQLVIVGRDEARTRETAAWLTEKSGNAQVDFLVADLSSQAEVRRLAASFKSTYPRLDVLLNNAGAIFTKREITVDGYERTWALNHLAEFLLTQLLLDRLEASAPARIVNVSSAAHTTGKIDFDNLQGEKKFSGIGAYSQSKLANILFTFALARRLAGAGVTANCLHPGVVATGFGHNTPGLVKTLLSLARPFLMTSEKGAATSIYLASSPEVAHVSGKYFAKSRPIASSKSSTDVALQEQLWELSEKQTAMAA